MAHKACGGGQKYIPELAQAVTVSRHIVAGSPVCQVARNFLHRVPLNQQVDSHAGFHPPLMRQGQTIEKGFRTQAALT